MALYIHTCTQMQTRLLSSDVKSKSRANVSASVLTLKKNTLDLIVSPSDYVIIYIQVDCCNNSSCEKLLLQMGGFVLPSRECQQGRGDMEKSCMGGCVVLKSHTVFYKQVFFSLSPLPSRKQDFSGSASFAHRS